MNGMLNETKLKFICIGTVNEMDMKLESKAKTEIGKKNERKAIPCQKISGKISIDTGHGIMTFYPEFTDVNWDGSYRDEEDSYWKMAKAMLDWNPKIKGNKDEAPTRVRLSGDFQVYNRYNDKTKKAVDAYAYRVRGASTTIAETAIDGMTISGNFFLNKFVDEEKNGEETGRVIVKMYCVDYKGECHPFDCIVTKENTDVVFNGDDGFDPLEEEQTRNISIGVFRVPEGGNTQVASKRRSFHNSYGESPEVLGGNRYVLEYIMTSAAETDIKEPDEPTTIDDEGNEVEVQTDWIDPKTIRKAVKIHAQALKELEENPPKKKAPANNNNGNRMGSSLKADKGRLRQQRAPDPVPAPVPEFEDDADWTDEDTEF